MMMEILGLMMQMGARRDDGQVEGCWMDGRWQWWLEGRQQITTKKKESRGRSEKVK